MKVPAVAVAMTLALCGCSIGAPQPASDITDTGATLNGYLFSTDSGTDVTYWFRYGTTTAYGQRTPERTVHVPAGSQYDFQPVSEPIARLTPYSTYHYRLCTAPPRVGCLTQDRALTTGPGLVFVSGRGGSAEQVWRMDGGGHDPRPLGPAGSTNPAVSLDGSKIAFSAYIGGNSAIWVMDADGTHVHAITDGSSFDDNAAWSPDGTRIVFASDRDHTSGDGNFDLYSMDADGSNVARLTNAPGVNYQPTWAPDGTRIAFSSSRSGIHQIWSMDADGGSPTLLSDGSGLDYSPAWAPDGSKIAFAHGSLEFGPGDIWVMDANGDNPTNLTGDPGEDGLPSWSPDGSRIAFGSGRDGNGEVYLMKADGSGQTRLTSNPAFDALPAWVPAP